MPKNKTFNSKKKRKIIIVIGSLLILLAAGGITLALFGSKDKQKITPQPTKNPSSSPNDDNPSTPSQSDSGSKKKILAQQIKADLQKDLGEAKKGDKIIRTTYFKSLGDGCCGDGRGERLTFAGASAVDYLDQNVIRRKGDIFPNELEPVDWTEIVNLINQINQLEREQRARDEQKNQEWEAQKDQKLKSNPNMFFYHGLDDWEDYTGRYFFLGWANNQRFTLVIPENHPVVANLSDYKGRDKEQRFLLIEGVQNLPFELKKIGKYPWKQFKLADKILIKSC